MTKKRSWIMAAMPADRFTQQFSIAAALREQIHSGELTAGSQIPSEENLAKAKRVSRTTARAAIDELRREGYVITHKDRRGTVVRELPLLLTMLTSIERGRLDDPASGDDWAARVRAQGGKPRQDVRALGDVPAPAMIVERLPERVGLRVEPGELVARRERLRWDGDRAVQLSNSWFPQWVADTPIPGTDRLPFREAGDVVLPGGLLAAVGLPQKRLDGRITAGVVSPDARRAMALSRDTLVLVATIVGYDGLGRPVRVEVREMPVDRNALGFTVEP